MGKMRATLAVVCGVLCVAGLVFGVVFTYTSRTLFDASRFSQRAADSLAEPAVARVVAAEVTDQIIEARRDLTAYRPIILGTVEYVVSSAPFRALIRRAAKRAHATLISETGEDLALAAADLGVVVRNALAMYPEIAEKIPERAQLVLGSPEDWPNGKLLQRALRIGHRLRVRSVVWLSVGFAAGVCGLWLTRRRDRYLLRVGIGLTITSLVLGAVARFGGEVMAAFAQSPVVADLVRGMWPVFVGPLALRMLILAAIGLVLVAGVTSLLQKVDLESLARTLWRRIETRPLRSRWAFPRALLFICAGMLVVLFPSHAIDVIFVIAGGALFFVGIQEVFTIAARFFPQAQAAIEAATERKRSAWPRVAVVGGLVLALAGAGAYWLSRDDDGVVAAAGSALDPCNLHPELCDKRLNDVAFATTHNSMAAADISDWMFPNQERGLRAQLEEGVRGFLIDIHFGVPVGDRIRTELEDEKASMEKYTEALGAEGVDAAMRIRDRLVGEPSGDREVYLCHGFCELGAERFFDALEGVRGFLVANPREVLIIVIQDEGVAPADVATCFEKSGLVEFVYQGSVTPPWPTLREMIDGDQRVLVFAENNAEGVPWYHHVWEVFQETPYRFLDPAEFSNKPGRGGTSGSLLLMNHWIETTPAPKPSNAEVVNAYDFLLKRARACKRERRMVPNLIAVDFYGTGDLLRVVDAMNGIEEPTVVAP
ncbi:MAG TPA: hypothetical protein VEC56_05470 [Candidatus Krumholzibacteria bacterium]|nr:hypothetical protein [Candidatus Krumholzibacteria bacterium]